MARKVNQELSLTSYIDLMSTLIIFLLMTAVWTHIDALSTNTSSVTSSDGTSSDKTKKVQLSITIFPDKTELAEDSVIQAVPHVGGYADQDGIKRQLGRWKAKYPSRNDVILNTINEVPYRLLIEVFDVLVGNGWPDVGVNTI